MKKKKITNKIRKAHNRNLSDAALYDFLQMIKYKSEWYGTNIMQLGQYEASTIICSCCGYKREKLETNIRKWTCPECGASHDRDVNAAKVIENKARIALGLS